MTQLFCLFWIGQKRNRTPVKPRLLITQRFLRSPVRNGTRNNNVTIYNTIPQDRGEEIIENQLKERRQVAVLYNQFIVELLSTILTRNAFMCGSSHFFQVQGVAMGTQCAPSYVNLCLGGWERELFAHVILWYWNIDNVLLFWCGTRMNFCNF